MAKMNNRLVSYSVIVAAKTGDAEAMQKVFRRYAGYIRTLATRPFYDENGNRHSIVDETICRELENHLAKVIIEKFRVVSDE